MNQPIKTLTLREFGAYLGREGAGFKASELKSLPFSAVFPKTGTSAVLEVQNPSEFAEVFVMAAGLAYLDKKKDALKALMAENLNEETFAVRIAELEASWPVQAIARKSDGRPEFDPVEKIPRVQIDALKLGALLAHGEHRVLLQGVDLADAEHLKAIAAAIPSRATHLVKLSVDTGSSREDVKGGLFKVTPCNVPSDIAGSVSEQDFLTPTTQALTCSAGYQAKDWLAFTQVRYGATTGCLVDLLSRDNALCTAVQDCLTKFQGAAKLFELFGGISAGTFSGEPQLFCGEGPATQVVAPLMPVSLPMELLRAKAALKAMRDAELAGEVDVASAAVASAEAALASLKGIGAKAYPAGKPAYAVALAAAKEAVASATVSLGRAGKGYLNVPTFTLMLGGSSPQNVGSGLTSAIHNAPVLTQIRERVLRAEIGNKVFYADRLLAVPRIKLEKAPYALTEKADNAADRRARRALFSAWALASLSPLLELREAWEHGTQSSSGALYAEALARLADATDEKALFIKGSPGVTGKAAGVAFSGLTALVISRIKEGARTAFKDLSLNQYDAELRAAVEAVVLSERT